MEQLTIISIIVIAFTVLQFIALSRILAELRKNQVPNKELIDLTEEMIEQKKHMIDQNKLIIDQNKLVIDQKKLANSISNPSKRIG